MDSHFHHLHATEVGWQTKHARVPTKDDEDKLWNSGVMGTRTPRAVQNAVFYVVGKMFSLRGGVEMRQVKISQIRRHARQICVHGACFKAQQWNVKKAAHCKQSVSSVLAAQHTCVYNEQHSTFPTVTVSFEPPCNRQNIWNLHGCTININNTPPNPFFNCSQVEVDESWKYGWVWLGVWLMPLFTKVHEVGFITFNLLKLPTFIIYLICSPIVFTIDQHD